MGKAYHLLRRNPFLTAIATCRKYVARSKFLSRCQWRHFLNIFNCMDCVNVKTTMIDLICGLFIKSGVFAYVGDQGQHALPLVGPICCSKVVYSKTHLDCF